MEIKKSIKNLDDFNNYFEGNKFEIIEVDINRKNVSFGILKIKANEFDWENFYRYLAEISITYALPSERIERLVSEHKFKTLLDETQMKFIRSEKSKNGEGGELILYSLLENILHAPKLLSKMKLKTNSEMPVFGSDGIHILPLSDNNFELIFCESKMYGDLDKGLNEAFSSVKRFIDDDKLLNFENTVISTNLRGEFSDEVVDELCNKILPSREIYKTNNAISIFVGFEFTTENYDKSLDYNEYSTLIQNEVSKWIGSKKVKLEKYFKEHSNYSFYVYIIPFENIDKTRKRIIEEIEGREFSE